jgi:hypothetical protein
MSYDEPRGDTGPTTRTPPPQPEGALQEVIRGNMKANKRHPTMMPNSPHEAALFWMRHQESESQRDRPEWIWKHGSDAGGSWNTPYNDRVVETLHKFLGLSAPHQEYVIQQVKAGYPYRGDSIQFYIEVCKQTDIQAEYVKEHGRDPDGLLPREYTGAIMKAAIRLSMKMSGKLPASE